MLVRVQQLAVLLRERPEDLVLETSLLLHYAARCLFTDGTHVSAEVRGQWLTMLAQAIQMRSLIVIIDGIDEAAGRQEAVCRFARETLVYEGFRVVCTGRLMASGRRAKGGQSLDDFLPRFVVYHLEAVSTFRAIEVAKQQLQSVVKESLGGEAVTSVKDDEEGNTLSVSAQLRVPSATAELRLLSALDDRLVNLLLTGDVRLVRSAWLLSRPLGYRMHSRHELESARVYDARRALQGEVSPLLSPGEAVALARKCCRGICALSACWQTPDNPDPSGVIVDGLRETLAAYTHLEAVYWDWASLVPFNSDPATERKHADKDEATRQGALRAVAAIFSSPVATTVLMLRELVPTPTIGDDDNYVGPAFDERPFNTRGWRCLESVLSSEVLVRLISRPSVSSALSELPPKILKRDAAEEPASPYDLKYAAPVATRLKSTIDTLSRATFTDETDRELMIELYRSFVKQTVRALARVVPFLEEVRSSPLLLQLLVVVILHRSQNDPTSLPADVFALHRAAFSAFTTRYSAPNEEEAVCFDQTIPMLVRLAVANMQASGRREFGADDAEKALTGHEGHLALWSKLAYEEGNVPLITTLESSAVSEIYSVGTGRTRRLGRYQFHHPELQEALCAESAADTPAWRNDELARAFLKVDRNARILRVGGGTLGTALAERREAWKFVDAGINDSQCGVVAKLLEGNGALISLDLSSNDLGADAGRALARGLEVNDVLRHLGLAGNNLGAGGAAAIAKVLESNSSLISLDCSGNMTPRDNVGETGALSLAEALKSNDKLTTLVLNYNSIGALGAKRLCQALEVNQALTTLGLFDNKLRPEGGQEFRLLLFKDSIKLSLTYLDVRSNALGEEMKEDLLYAAKRKGTVQVDVW